MTNQRHPDDTSADDLDDFFNEVSQVEAEVGDVQQTSQSHNDAHDDDKNPPPPPAKKPKLLRPPGAVMVAAASSATTSSATTTTATVKATKNYAQHLESESQQRNVTSRSTAYPPPPPPPPPPRGWAAPPPPPPPPYPSRYATQQSTHALVVPYPNATTVPSNPNNNNNNIDDWPAGGFRLFVGNLGNEITDHDLFQHFSAKYPSLERAKVISSAAATGPKPKKKAQSSYGFVCFANALECARAKREMDQTWLGSRPIRIKKYLGDTGSQAAASQKNDTKSSTKRGQRR